MANSRRLVFAVFAGVVFGGAFLGGCGSRVVTGPSATVERYSNALTEKDYAAAYGLMSADFRMKYSKEAFMKMMRENHHEVAATAKRLKQRHESVEVTAEFHYGIGDTLELVREGGNWRIASNPVLFYGFATPRDALRSFVRAYRLERWDIMLTYVPDVYREQMTADSIKEQFRGEKRSEMELMMNLIEANIDQPIIDRGNEARMPYGDKYEVVFVREDGKWKIQDFDGN